MFQILKDFLVAAAFLAAIFGAAIKEFAPDVWIQILRLLGI